MAAFLGDIAFMLEALVLGIGLLFIAWGRREDPPSRLITNAGWVLSILAILGFACTAGSYINYWRYGELDYAYAPSEGARGDNDFSGSRSFYGMPYYHHRHMLRHQHRLSNAFSTCMKTAAGQQINDDTIASVERCIKESLWGGSSRQNESSNSDDKNQTE